MKLIKELLDGATALGACRKTDGIDTLDKLIALYESPQGREFCAKHKYPSREQWIRIKKHWGASELSNRNVYIDNRCAHLIEQNPGTIVLVGAETRAQLVLSGADEKQTITVLHDATANITASDYAVFEVITDGTANIEISKDDTAIQL